MQSLSKFEYEKVSKPSDRKEGIKISKIHQYLLWFESLLTVRNLIILCLTILLFIFQVYPYGKFLCLKFDERYTGYYRERLPRLALTTMQKKYYSENGIAFKTIEDVKIARE